MLERADDPAHSRITDLHVWRVGKCGYSLAATLVTHDATLTPHAVRQQLLVHEEIMHSSTEIHVCENHHDQVFSAPPSAGALAVAMWDFDGRRRPPFALTPGEGEESVWDYPRPPRCALDARQVVVRAPGGVLASSTRAIRLLETASPPGFYLPPEDVDTAQLAPAPGRSLCEWKGAAVYWRLANDPAGQPIGWSYPAPHAAFAVIAGYFAFYPGRVACFVNDERVAPQPGGFYGGWVTREIVGPWKGDPGTGHW